MKICNPLKLKVDDENISLLFNESESTGIPYSKLINTKVRNSYKLISGDDFLSYMELPSVIRMKSFNCVRDGIQITKLLRSNSVYRVVFGAKLTDGDTPRIIMALEFDTATILIDKIYNNIGSEPRRVEFKEILDQLFKCGLEKKSLVIPSFVKDTSQLAAHEALDTLYAYKMEYFDLDIYLDLLANGKNIDTSTLTPARECDNVSREQASQTLRKPIPTS